jgi:hypothetical protein
MADFWCFGMTDPPNCWTRFGGWHTWGGVRFSALPLHSAELAIPSCPPDGLDIGVVGFLGWLLLLPNFLGCLVAQVLMQADAVVPMFEFIKQALQLLGALNLDLIELLFQSAEEALDSAVLPWAVQIDALVADVLRYQTLNECAAVEAALVVCADAAGFAVLRSSLLEMLGKLVAVFAGDEQAQQRCVQYIHHDKNEQQEMRDIHPFFPSTTFYVCNLDGLNAN